MKHGKLRNKSPQKKFLHCDSPICQRQLTTKLGKCSTISSDTSAVASVVCPSSFEYKVRSSALSVALLSLLCLLLHSIFF